MNDVDLLRLRCCKFPPRLLKDAEAAVLALKNTGWSCDLLDEHFAEALTFASQTRRDWLAKRRARRAAERAADKAFNATRNPGIIQAAA
jgi:hypothetical protein